MTGENKWREEYNPQDEEWQVAKLFFSFNPPEYSGSSDPSVTWNWIINMEEAFDACGCDEAHKVKLAVRMLRGWGLEWWATFSKTKTKAWIMDWVEFKNGMMNDFCVKDHKSKLESEFLSFKKEDMSVEEYAREFVKKMRLVKHLVKDESYKIRRFKEGLNCFYQNDELL
ncbi:hypothetical protein LXL04_006561 [Taraxacum kok-saghyz]